MNIANSLEKQINENTREHGSKLPSVRLLSKELNVSIGTIQHAYAILEDKELIISRERSGFFVNKIKQIEIDPPRKISFTEKPTEVKMIETSIEVMELTKKDCKFQLGSAIPYIEEKTVKQLYSSLKKSAHYSPNSYEGVQGYIELRKQIAKRSIRTGKVYSEYDIIVTSGCQESLTIAIQITTNPGDLIAVESPCYYGILQTLDVLKRKVLEIPVCPTKGMDLNLLEGMIDKHPVKAILINPSFSNPTGFCYSESEKEYFSNLVDKKDIVLIEDDVFAELGKKESRPRTIHSYNKNGNVLLCSSYSKTLSQDLRIGWIEAGRFYKDARAYKYASTLGTSPIQQYILANYLSTQNYERHLRFISGEYQKRQRIFLKLLKELFPEGTKASQPEGGYLCWVKLPFGGKERETDSLELYKRAIASGVSITPGALFSTANRFNNYIRLNYGYIDKESIPEALTILSDIVSK